MTFKELLFGKREYDDLDDRIYQVRKQREAYQRAEEGRKKAEQAVMVATIEADPRPIEQQIHEEIFSAQEVLLAEAKRILEDAYDIESHQAKTIDELIALGFGSMEGVQEHQKQKQQVEENKRTIQFIEYYQQNYPFNKFITHKAVMNVCKKYQLVFAEVSRYSSDIPDKNKREIVAFRVKGKDIPGYLNEDYQIEIDYGVRGYHLSGSDGMKLRQQENYKKDFEERKASAEKLIPGKELKILAPYDKVILKYGEAIEGNRIINKDPIVLQPVNGGYLIISAWGLEASDEQVRNEINN